MSLLTKERPGMVMQLIYLKICLVFHFFRRLNRYRWQRLHEQDKAHRLLRDFSIPSQTHLSSRALAQLCRRFSYWLTLQLQLVSGGCRWISLRKQPRLSSLLTTRYTSRGVRRRGGGGEFAGVSEFAPKWISLFTLWAQRQNFCTDDLNQWKILKVVTPQSAGVACERWSSTRGSNLRILTGKILRISQGR